MVQLDESFDVVNYLLVNITNGKGFIRRRCRATSIISTTRIVATASGKEALVLAIDLSYHDAVPPHYCQAGFCGGIEKDKIQKDKTKQVLSFPFYIDLESVIDKIRRKCGRYQHVLAYLIMLKDEEVGLMMCIYVGFFSPFFSFFLSF